MESIENKNKRRVRRTELQEAVLATVAAAGIIGVAIVATPVIGAMSKIGVLPYSRQSEVVRSTANRLWRRGLLKLKDNHYELTDEGRRVLELWQLSNYRLLRPRKWDKKWRVLIFDIPEKKRAIREEMRQIFNSAGLYRLQDSVWVYPYDCENVIGLLKTEFGIGRDLLYIIADQIENDRHLRSHFRLPT